MSDLKSDEELVDALAAVSHARPGHIYRHYKSKGLYEVLHLAYREEDLVPVVVYVRLNDDKAWTVLVFVRTVESWREPAWCESRLDYVPRFEIVEESPVSRPKQVDRPFYLLAFVKSVDQDDWSRETVVIQKDNVLAALADKVRGADVDATVLRWMDDSKPGSVVTGDYWALVRLGDAPVVKLHARARTVRDVTLKIDDPRHRSGGDDS